MVRSVGKMWQCFPLEFMMHIGAKEPSGKQACLTILGPHTFAGCPAQLLRQGGILSLVLNEANISQALTRESFLLELF